ncbi:MAG: hypothetical protein K0A90_00220 [Methanosarcinaceae archaeon]|nr:hypothetical protein [Methanosarcinaceae archaeon]
MAVIDNIVKKEVTGVLGMVVLKAKLTGTTSTITTVEHGLSEIFSAIIVARGINGATYTISGTTITVTGTNNDDIECIIFGSI